MSNFLHPEEIQALKGMHKTSDRKKADKIKAILLLNAGYNPEEIARILLLDNTTIRRWYSIYESKGIDVLLTYHYVGSDGKLTAKQIAALNRHLENTIYLTAKEICAYVEKKYGVQYTSKGMTNLLHRLSFSYRKPKHIPGKASQKAQEEFIEQYIKLKENKSKHDRIWFMDAVHPLHNSQPAHGWMKKGFDYTIKSNTGRGRVNINGAYNIEDHKAVIEEADCINSQSTVALFNKLLKEQPLGIIYLVLDNAKYYRSKVVKEFQKANPRIQLVFLPPYSPNLNIIERLWKFFKKKITYNTYYEKFAVFKYYCLNFFEKIEKHKKELRSLMTDNFQVIQA
jgi:transposase